MHSTIAFVTALISTLIFSGCAPSGEAGSTLAGDGLLSGQQVTLPFDDGEFQAGLRCAAPDQSGCQWILHDGDKQFWKTELVGTHSYADHGIASDRSGQSSDAGHWLSVEPEAAVSVEGAYLLYTPSDMAAYGTKKVTVNLRADYAFVPNGHFVAIDLSFGCEQECFEWNGQDECVHPGRPGFHRHQRKDFTGQRGGWRHDAIEFVEPDLDLSQCGHDLFATIFMQALEVQPLQVRAQFLTN